MVNVHHSLPSFKPPEPMRMVGDLSLSPAEQLACDEALLDLCETNGGAGFLRFWEPESVFIVLGRTGIAAREVRLDVCREREIPVLRRASGGGTVVQCPGCLNFSLILQIAGREGFATAGSTNTTIMSYHAEVLSSLAGERVEVSGFSDLTIRGQKISGNAQRRRLRYFLFHGCILLKADLDLIEDLLPHPPREPAYRNGRAHTAFVRNLLIEAAPVKEALRKSWNAEIIEHSIPRDKIDLLTCDRYMNPAWTAL
jgi:lipoate-protein ligase A